MMKTKKILLIAILITQVLFSQKKNSRADRFFEKGDYINAALQYEEELNQEGYTKHVLKNIATSYHNTFQFRKAYRYLKILTSGKFYDRDKTYENHYNFLMYQVLSALGEYEKSVEFLALYKSNETAGDFNTSDAIATIENFKLKDDDYTIQSVAFNSEASEFGAVKRDSLIYFTSDRSPNSLLDKNYMWTHRPFLNIFQIKVDKDNLPIGDAESISEEINSKLHEGNFCFTADGNTLFISKSNVDKKKKKFDSINNNAVHLYRAQKVEGKWTTPVKMTINNVHYSIEHPALNNDESKLYFASNMPGGSGDFDLYYVDLNIDGTYGKPVNLGPVINTANREQFPFVAKDGHLFFSSNGHLGLGMMDVFVSELKNDSFTDPINLGAPINSSYDDFSMVYHNETDGFFASNRKNVGDDIYSFTQTGEIFLREYISNFEVRDFTSDGYVPNAKVILYDSNKKEVYNEQLDSIAVFSLHMLPGKYSFDASAEGYKEKSRSIVIKEKDEERYIIYLDKTREDIAEKTNKSENTETNKVTSEERSSNKERINITEKNTETRTEIVDKVKLREILLADKEGPPVIEKDGKLFFEMPPIYFDYDKWNIRADSKKVLDKLALKLEKYKTVYLKISSHTDSRGSDEYNQLLSERRAESTRNYLALIGYVNARRMQFVGFGESQPIIDCDSKVCTEDDHQTNRRSEFEIVKF